MPSPGRLCRRYVIFGTTSCSKSPILLGFFRLICRRKTRKYGRLAEGEELGSNLLRVAHRSRGYSGGPGALAIRTKAFPKQIPATREAAAILVFGAITGPPAASKPSPSYLDSRHRRARLARPFRAKFGLRGECRIVLFLGFG
jgi:hypothetical protein